jgi:mono/diheme cytochrome c family protein
MPVAVGTDDNRQERSSHLRHMLFHVNSSLPMWFGLLFVGWLGMETATVSHSAWAESSQSEPTEQSGKLKGNIMQGREIFNGKGVCYYCHGIDGYLHKIPRLEADTAKLIANLDPPPTDLRNPDVLRLTTNKERIRAIREGHPGTGMFPDTTMTDQDLADIMLYLALIRKDPHPEQ